MKRPKTKAQIRRELDRQVEAFLTQGGKISSVAPGTSGHDPYRPLPINLDKTTSSRTSVLGQMRAIDARKLERKPPKKQRPKENKVLLMDDFGEPLRWVWQDE